MNFKVKMLEAAVEWLVGGDAFALVQEVVATVNDEDLTGAEKREKVQEIVMNRLGTISKVLLNISIEVAVFLLREQLTQEKGA